MIIPNLDKKRRDTFFVSCGSQQPVVTVFERILPGIDAASAGLQCKATTGVHWFVPAASKELFDCYTLARIS
jgi:hypothetical protein